MIFALPTMAAAQDGDDDAYWYISMYSVPW